MDENLDQYVDGKINASQWRVLMTKWVGEVWSKVGKIKDSVISSFKKCRLSVALDGSENNEVNIEGMPSAFVNMYWMVTVNRKKKTKIRVTLKMRKSFKF